MRLLITFLICILVVKMLLHFAEFNFVEKETTFELNNHSIHYIIEKIETYNEAKSTYKAVCRDKFKNFSQNIQSFIFLDTLNAFAMGDTVRFTLSKEQAKKPQ
jgi:hypothetical protein